MADKIKVWFDAEADYLEVRFSDAAGYAKETAHDAVMERVDAAGQAPGPIIRNRKLLKIILVGILKNFLIHGGAP